MKSAGWRRPLHFSPVEVDHPAVFNWTILQFSWLKSTSLHYSTGWRRTLHFSTGQRGRHIYIVIFLIIQMVMKSAVNVDSCTFFGRRWPDCSFLLVNVDCCTLPAGWRCWCCPCWSTLSTFNFTALFITPLLSLSFLFCYDSNGRRAFSQPCLLPLTYFIHVFQPLQPHHLSFLLNFCCTIFAVCFMPLKCFLLHCIFY